MGNSDNPAIGMDFQEQVRDWFQENYGEVFHLEKKLPIGNPPKHHKFDIVNVLDCIVIECKCYTWTASGNVPSAKMGFTNEAAFYLGFLPDKYRKYIVMQKSRHPTRNESLAEYYYRINRHLLGNITVMEFNPVNNTMAVIDSDSITEDGKYLHRILSYLSSKGQLYESDLPEKIKTRKSGIRYTLNDHIRGIIYALLTNQTSWYRIEPHLPEIDTLFFEYDPDRILGVEPTFFINALFKMKCGNVSTRLQMESLPDIIQRLRSIEEEFGSVDTFIESEPPEIIARKLSNSASPYKIKMLGKALSWEYLRYMGIDGAKPDTHLRRFFGSDRMGSSENHSPATSSEVQSQVSRLSEATGLLRVEIDNLIWSFCANGYGEICTANPRCELCLISDKCNKGRIDK